jgi:thymidine phosphorylase
LWPETKNNSLYPVPKVKIYVPSKPGGTTDATARALAQSIIRTAAEAGLKTHAVMTDMNEVLGTTAGNALEIAESIRFLRGDAREARLDDVTLSLCAEMLVVAGAETDRDAARLRCDEAVNSGRAAAAFGRMVAALGGPTDIVERFDTHLAKAPVVRAVHASGYVGAMDTRAVGNAIIELGGGRKRVGETLNLSVGFSHVARVGTELDADTPLAIVHAASEADAERAERNLFAAVSLADAPPAQRPVIQEILTG